MFDTISEFKAAMGTGGFGVGFVGGGGGGFAVADDGLNGTGIGFAGGLAELDDAVVGEGAAFVCIVFAGVGLEAIDGVDGFENFTASAAGGVVFGYCSRSLFNIFDVSGVVDVLTVGFAEVGAGFCAAAAEGLNATVGATGLLALGLDTGFSTTGGFADVDAFATGVFGPAFVDFALVVVFLVASDISTSTGSEMTFLGLPLFFTTSEDMLGAELSCEDLSLGADSQKTEL
jgi:hypothetical protein